MKPIAGHLQDRTMTCVCVTSPLGVHAFILSHHLYFFIDEDRAKKKYFSINFCWRLSVFGHRSSKLWGFGGWRVDIVETILDDLLKSIEKETTSLWMHLNSYKSIDSFNWYKCYIDDALVFLDSDDTEKEGEKKTRRLQ